MASQSLIKVVEESHVGPPAGSVPATFLPLTFFDIHWIVSCPIQSIFFYQLPVSSTLRFTSSTLPQLKHSLSLTLRHFFTMAVCLIIKPPHKPYVLYTDGDSVPFALCETAMDFDRLAGDGERVAVELQALVPSSLPPARERKEGKGQPVLAVQVTVFPKSGISIGITFSHVAADGSSMAHFMKSWASVNRYGGDSTYLPDHSHRRDLISDPNNDFIASCFLRDGWYWEDLSSIPSDKIRVTFAITHAQIQKLKDWVVNLHKQGLKNASMSEPPALRISTFVVTCALIWTCLVRAQQNDDDEAVCHLIFQADRRRKLKLPPNYFGNCVGPCFARAKRSDLTGETGVLEAARAIGSEISEFEKSPLKDAETWVCKAKEIFQVGRHVMTVAGSPRLGVYETDFGWGRPRKRELAHIGSYGSISVAERREENGRGAEFGLALSYHELHNFRAAYTHFLTLLPVT